MITLVFSLLGDVKLREMVDSPLLYLLHLNRHNLFIIFLLEHQLLRKIRVEKKATLSRRFYECWINYSIDFLIFDDGNLPFKYPRDKVLSAISSSQFASEHGLAGCVLMNLYSLDNQ